VYNINEVPPISLFGNQTLDESSLHGNIKFFFEWADVIAELQVESTTVESLRRQDISIKQLSGSDFVCVVRQRAL
jgi:hypothetical protein